LVPTPALITIIVPSTGDKYNVDASASLGNYFSNAITLHLENNPDICITVDESDIFTHTFGSVIGLLSPPDPLNVTIIIVPTGITTTPENTSDIITSLPVISVQIPSENQPCIVNGSDTLNSVLSAAVKLHLVENPENFTFIYDLSTMTFDSVITVLQPMSNIINMVATYSTPIVCTIASTGEIITVCEDHTINSVISSPAVLELQDNPEKSIILQESDLSNTFKIVVEQLSLSELSNIILIVREERKVLVQVVEDLYEVSWNSAVSSLFADRNEVSLHWQAQFVQLKDDQLNQVTFGDIVKSLGGEDVENVVIVVQ